MRRNSRTPSWAFLTRSDVVSTVIPSCTSMKQLGWSEAPARPADLDEAHPAHADRGHPRVVAEPRDEGAGSLRGGDEQIALPRLDLASVEGEGQPVVGGGPGGGRVSHKGSRLP